MLQMFGKSFSEPFALLQDVCGNGDGKQQQQQQQQQGAQRQQRDLAVLKQLVAQYPVHYSHWLHRWLGWWAAFALESKQERHITTTITEMRQKRLDCQTRSILAEMRMQTREYRQAQYRQSLGVRYQQMRTLRPALQLLRKMRRRLKRRQFQLGTLCNRWSRVLMWDVVYRWRDLRDTQHLILRATQHATARREHVLKAAFKQLADILASKQRTCCKTKLGMAHGENCTAVRRMMRWQLVQALGDWRLRHSDLALRSFARRRAVKSFAHAVFRTFVCCLTLHMQKQRAITRATLWSNTVQLTNAWVCLTQWYKEEKTVQWSAQQDAVVTFKLQEGSWHLWRAFVRLNQAAFLTAAQAACRALRTSFKSWRASTITAVLQQRKVEQILSHSTYLAWKHWQLWRHTRVIVDGLQQKAYDFFGGCSTRHSWVSWTLKYQQRVNKHARVTTNVRQVSQLLVRRALQWWQSKCQQGSQQVSLTHCGLSFGLQLVQTGTLKKWRSEAAVRRKGESMLHRASIYASRTGLAAFWDIWWAIHTTRNRKTKIMNRVAKNMQFGNLEVHWRKWTNVAAALSRYQTSLEVAVNNVAQTAKFELGRSFSAWGRLSLACRTRTVRSGHGTCRLHMKAKGWAFTALSSYRKQCNDSSKSVQVATRRYNAVLISYCWINWSYRAQINVRYDLRVCQICAKVQKTSLWHWLVAWSRIKREVARLQTVRQRHKRHMDKKRLSICLGLWLVRVVQWEDALFDRTTAKKHWNCCCNLVYFLQWRVVAGRRKILSKSITKLYKRWVTAALSNWMASLRQLRHATWKFNRGHRHLTKQWLVMAMCKWRSTLYSERRAQKWDIQGDARLEQRLGHQVSRSFDVWLMQSQRLKRSQVAHRHLALERLGIDFACFLVLSKGCKTQGWIAKRAYKQLCRLYMLRYWQFMKELAYNATEIGRGVRHCCRVLLLFSLKSWGEQAAIQKREQWSQTQNFRRAVKILMKKGWGCWLRGILPGIATAKINKKASSRVAKMLYRRMRTSWNDWWIVSINHDRAYGKSLDKGIEARRARLGIRGICVIRQWRRQAQISKLCYANQKRSQEQITRCMKVSLSGLKRWASERTSAKGICEGVAANLRSGDAEDILVWWQEVVVYAEKSRRVKAKLNAMGLRNEWVENDASTMEEQEGSGGSDEETSSEFSDPDVE